MHLGVCSHKLGVVSPSWEASVYTITKVSAEGWFGLVVRNILKLALEIVH